MTAAAIMSSKPSFLNVDVDAVGLAGGQALAGYFRERAVVLRDESDGFSFEAPEQHRDADASIADLISLIRAMPSELTSAWHRSSERSFDIGYESNLGDESVTVEISNASLQAVAEIGAKLRVTLYRQT